MKTFENIHFREAPVEGIFCIQTAGLSCFFTMFCRSEIGDLYPNKFVNLDEKRIYVLNTLFHLPGMSFDTVNFLDIMQVQKVMARF